MKKYNVAVLGATGAVGREMLKVLAERNFPINTLKCLASPRSVGSKINFAGQELTVELACDEAFEGMDIVLGAVDNKYAKQFAPAIKAAGAVFVDNSSAFRLCDDVPLVIPEINPEDALKNNGIIANPNCSTIIALVAVNAIKELSPIKTIVASTYQAVSGAGAEGLIELENQAKAYVNGGEMVKNVFPYQIAFNLIPQIGGFGENGYTSEEMKMQNEGRKILHLPELKVNCTCVRVPVMRSHSISIALTTERSISVEEAKAAIASAKGCKLVDDPETKAYPMPLDTSDQDLVYVGRIRRDLTNEEFGLTLWCCGDQVRKGAATNAVQIAELLTK
ncbi:MAG: aspartate-semialdehyde dehydrogenase [Clostridia bacterium]|nr:aspartate-semialdehyde dehydrogenase [Clostridia bacterium]